MVTKLCQFHNVPPILPILQIGRTAVKWTWWRHRNANNKDCSPKSFLVNSFPVPVCVWWAFTVKKLANQRFIDCFGRDPRPAMSNLRPSLGFRFCKISYTLTTCPDCNSLELEIFDAGGFQCHFIMSVTISVRIQTLSTHQLKLNLVC